ncbi:uncharacterized protein LOC135200284 [Macrobrachium nipponense]|uniref:uncharacterized protein LOC135200284 n=1 Tax=Macrobrachium nipponense TaxID=159736 RepID=UPI0030C7BFE5
MGSSCRDLRLIEGTPEKEKPPSMTKSEEGNKEGLEQPNILQQIHSYDSLLESQITEDERETAVDEVLEHENENSESVAIGLDDTEDMEAPTLNWISSSSSAPNIFSIHSTSASPSVTSSGSHSSLSPSEDDSGIHPTSAYSNIDEIDPTLKPSLTPRSNLDSLPQGYSFKCEDLPSTTVVYELEYTYTDPGRFAMILQFQDPVTDEVIWKLERRVLVMELLQVELGPSDLLAVDEGGNAFAYAHLSLAEAVIAQSSQEHSDDNITSTTKSALHNEICPNGIITWNWDFGDEIEGRPLPKNCGICRNKRGAFWWSDENYGEGKSSRRNVKILSEYVAEEVTEQKNNEDELIGKYAESRISAEAADEHIKELGSSENIPMSAGLLTEMAVQQANGQDKKLEEMAKLAEEEHKFPGDGSPGSDGVFHTTLMSEGVFSMSGSSSPSPSPSLLPPRPEKPTPTTAGDLEEEEDSFSLNPTVFSVIDAPAVSIHRDGSSSIVDDLSSSTSDSGILGSPHIYASDDSSPTLVTPVAIKTTASPAMKVDHIYQKSGIYDFTAVLYCDGVPIRQKVVDAAFTVMVPLKDVKISVWENDTLLILHHETTEEARPELSEGSTSSFLLWQDKDLPEEEKSRWATRAVILRVDIGRGTLLQSPLLETGDGTRFFLEPMFDPSSGSWCSQIEYSYKSPGDFRPKVTVTNPLGSVEAHLNTTIQVQELPTSAVLIPPQYFVICGEPVTFLARATGSHLHYDWVLPFEGLLKDTGESPVCFMVPRNKINCCSSAQVQNEYRRDPPDVKSIKDWYKKFTETGSVEDLKRSGRPSVTDASIVAVRDAFHHVYQT